MVFRDKFGRVLPRLNTHPAAIARLNAAVRKAMENRNARD
jgi:hypothetical protein